MVYSFVFMRSCRAFAILKYLNTLEYLVRTALLVWAALFLIQRQQATTIRHEREIFFFYKSVRVNWLLTYFIYYTFVIASIASDVAVVFCCKNNFSKSIIFKFTIQKVWIFYWETALTHTRKRNKQTHFFPGIFE